MINYRESIISALIYLYGNMARAPYYWLYILTGSEMNFICERDEYDRILQNIHNQWE